MKKLSIFLKKDNNLMKDIQITAHLNILERAIIEKRLDNRRTNK